MSIQMLEWIAKQFDRDLVGEKRARFLHHLKTDDPRLHSFVVANLLNWQTEALAALNEELLFAYDANESAREVVEFWKQFFARELATVA